MEVAETENALEGSPFYTYVYVTDPDGDVITSLEAFPLPPGASFRAQPGNNLGLLEWTPSYDQAGVYLVTFTAQNQMTASEVMQIVVQDVDRPPLVVAPASLNDSESVRLTFTISAVDPDGQPIGELTALLLPRGATFTVNGDRSSATFDWTPSFSQAGPYTVIFTASSCPSGTQCLTGSATTNIKVWNVDRPPVLYVDPVLHGAEGASIVWESWCTVYDPDGDQITSITAYPLPTGASFYWEDIGCPFAYLSWTPTYIQAGTYTLTFRAESACPQYDGVPCKPGLATVRIEVADRNQPPTIDPGGPYFGVVSLPIAFNAERSSDPDGGTLTYTWKFGDFASAVGPSPRHAYSEIGTYDVRVTGTDGTSSATAYTMATVGASFPARAFTSEDETILSLGANGDTWCIRLEHEGESFATASLEPTSITLNYAGAQGNSSAPKSTSVADADQNGVPDVAVCFAMADLRAMFGGLAPGASVVNVDIEGVVRTHYCDVTPWPFAALLD